MAVGDEDLTPEEMGARVAALRDQFELQSDRDVGQQRQTIAMIEEVTRAVEGGANVEPLLDYFVDEYEVTIGAYLDEVEQSAVGLGSAVRRLRETPGSTDMYADAEAWALAGERLALILRTAARLSRLRDVIVARLPDVE
jgi:hypothetical protein